MCTRIAILILDNIVPIIYAKLIIFLFRKHVYVDKILVVTS